MACQSKTLIGDVGSAVLAEVISQLNRASGCIVGPAQNDTTLGLIVNLTWIPVEDVWVEDISFLTVGATDHANDSLLAYTGTNIVIDNVANTMRYSKTDFNAVGMAAGVHQLSTATSDTPGAWAPFSLNAGERLWFQFDVAGGSTQTLLDAITISYRPVQDYLTVSPNYTKAMQNFKSVAR